MTSPETTCEVYSQPPATSSAPGRDFQTLAQTTFSLHSQEEFRALQYFYQRPGKTQIMGGQSCKYQTEGGLNHLKDKTKTIGIIFCCY